MSIIINGDNTATSGGVAYGAGTTIAFSAAGTSGQVLTSAGTGAPTWGGVPAASLTGTVAITQGGTGQTTASAALNALGGASTGKAIAMAIVFGG